MFCQEHLSSANGDLAVLVDDKKPGFVSEAGLMSTVGAGTGFEPVTFRL